MRPSTGTFQKPNPRPITELLNSYSRQLCLRGVIPGRLSRSTGLWLLMQFLLLLCKPTKRAQGKSAFTILLRRPVKSQAFEQKSCFQKYVLQDHTEQGSLLAPGLSSPVLRNHFVL